MRFILCFILCIQMLSSLSAQELTKDNNSIKYSGIVELGTGIAYNLNTAQTVSTVNMQNYWILNTSQGVMYKGLFGGLGCGYNHTQRDKENMYLGYGDIRYYWLNNKVSPSIGMKLGIIYDPYWIEKLQKYTAFNGSVYLYKNFRIGLETSIFTRPSRHFTANIAIVMSYKY